MSKNSSENTHLHSPISIHQHTHEYSVLFISQSECIRIVHCWNTYMLCISCVHLYSSGYGTKSMPHLVHSLHTVHPNHVFTQHKSSNAECFFPKSVNNKNNYANIKNECEKGDQEMYFLCTRLLVWFFSSSFFEEEPWVKDMLFCSRRERVNGIENVHLLPEAKFCLRMRFVN